jgi:hypothetical protein
MFALKVTALKSKSELVSALALGQGDAAEVL